jgi:hypothetical protein
MKKISSAVLAAFLIIFFISCKKDIGLSGPTSLHTMPRGITPPTLAWESLDQMPTPVQYPGTIDVPWGSGASRQFSKEIANDYRSADGWTLVYNTFSTISIPDNWYFILYNRYRGILRMYYYIPRDANYITSANILDKLATEGSYAASSPMLNFADQEVVDVVKNSPFVSTVQQWQAAPGTWYTLQYELAYDQNMSAQNYSTFDFLWGMHTTQITKVLLDGTETGTITGNINIEGGDFTISPTFNIDASNNKSTITISGSSDADKVKPSLGQTIVNNIKSAITSGAQGIIKNLLSGIFKRSSAPVENVSLKINTSVHLEGSLTSDVLLTSPSFSIPGYNQSSTPGYVPLYNEPLGVFYITNRPVVQVTRAFIPNPDGGRDLRQYTFTPNSSSFQYIFNPSVLNIADISNFNTEVIVDDPENDIEATFISGATKESIGTREVYRIDEPLVLYDNLDYTGKVFVRLSFDVIPKDGNPPVRISKTFLANT